MQPVVPNKPVLPQYHPQSGGGSGNRACGCFAMGCGGSVLLLIALCSIGYYTIFNTGLPIQWVVERINKSNDVRIEGASGTLFSGGEIAKIRFKNPDQVNRATGEPVWSELTNLKFRYRPAFFAGSFTIDDISVEGGTIYADIDFDSDQAGDLVFSQLQEELSSIRADVGSGNSHGTLDIRRISIANLTIRDINSDTKFQIEKIRLNDLRIEDGVLVEFGDLAVNADNIELSTEETNDFSQARLERTFKGRLSKGLVSGLATDIPFEIKLGVMENGKIATRSNWFDGQIRLESENGDSPARYLIDGFSPAEHVRLLDSGFVVSDMHFDATYDVKKRLKLARLDPEGSFQLGQSRFSDFRIPDEGDGKPDLRVFEANAEVGGRKVEAQVFILPRLPLFGVKLAEAGDWSLLETWSQTVFGKSFQALKREEQELIETNIRLAKNRFTGGRDAVDETQPRKKNRPDDPPEDQDHTDQKPEDGADKSPADSIQAPAPGK